MYIEEVVVDGFKSYAHRTVIAGFDPHFNAITGLNGSGKSNILDAICFVLGITNLSQVRAGNLSELVYKQGQAGVNKAIVTIVFNNQDESTSPVGYEQCPEVTVTRQVLLGGKSKYLINGRNAPAGQVTNLFHSVQLNVNNPHFLIMQGRITKVLNMKPHEILGMVEEAAGTRMYETKRVAALKTIDKKQMKVDELNSVLAEEITPTLERLRGEKQSYLKWSKNSADIERLERFVVASEFVKAQQALDSNVEGSSEMEEKVEQLQEDATEYRTLIEDKEQEILALSSKLSGEFEETHNRAKAREEKNSKELVKVTSAWQNSVTVAKAADNDLKQARLALSEATNSVTSKENEAKEESERIERNKTEAEEAEREYARLQSDYQNMSAGISSSQGDQAGTLPDQICRAHSDSKTAEAKAKQAKMKIDHLKKSLKSVEKDMKKEAKSAESLAKKKEKAQAKVDDIQSQLSSMNFSEDNFNSLEQERVELDSSVSELRQLVDTLSAQLQGRLAFKYSDPVRGFDRSKVKGLVASLVNVKQPKHATALEVVAGGRLFQVVVDEAITGKALLNKGKLARRVTIIPLDKIQSRPVKATACEKADQIASGLGSSASPAIELIGFDEEVRNAMEYVFGHTLVVDGAKAANTICDATHTRTVTLDGDVYDPSGTISGGSKNNLGSTLSKLTELTQATEELAKKEKRLQTVISELDALKSVSSKFDKLSDKLELATAELAGVEKHLSQTSYGMLAEKYGAMSTEIDEATVEFEQMEKEKDDKLSLYHELKDKELELTRERESRLKHIDEAVKKAKQVATEKANCAREAESQSQTLVLEMENLQSEVSAAETAVDAAAKALDEANEEEANLQMKVGEVKALYDEAKSELESIEKHMAQFSSELSNQNDEKAKLVKKVEKAELEAKKLSVAIARIQKERGNAERFVSNLLKKHAWIESEKSAFGVAGGDYDFEATDPSEMSSQLKSLKDEQDSLAKKINKKVMGMIEKAEGEYTELLRKRKVVENDKKKIRDVIEELDVKKKSELERTSIKVNRDFGSIFSTLLPGASAKLEPPEGMEAWEGLEVKVAFGDVWKESLSELSGGQRSLLALSLILSLLLYKPAPMYILDEVDAALDLSHTQNIGNMLKTHFSHSQFIVVSLKEGMFNNANVIFRTKFVDGVSTVTRTIGTGSSVRPRALAEAENNEEAEDPPARKRAASSRRNRNVGKENATA